MSDTQPTVLLVDDNPTNLRVLLEALRGQDVKLIAATGGEQAIELAKRARPAVVLLDVMMPDIDGYETCQRLKADEDTRDIAIIFLTALTDTEEKVHGLSLGAADFVTKPFDPDEVVARLKVQLEQQDERRRLLEANRELLRQAAGAEVERPDVVRDLVDAGESERVEFKSTLRWSLTKNKPDLGVELSWLKTVVAFLNSDGGTLLVGVTDDHEVIGHEREGFPNDDRYLLHVNNRVQQHIGVEHAAHLRYSLEPLDDKKVLVFEVSPCPDAVFLRKGNDESYYIRVGPGSRKLTMSQMLAHVRQREQGRGT